MKRLFANRLFKIVFWVLVVGSGPLLLIIGLVRVGLWPDSRQNPIGPGLMAFFSFWPSIICMAIGAAQAMFGKRR